MTFSEVFTYLNPEEEGELPIKHLHQTDVYSLYVHIALNTNIT